MPVEPISPNDIPEAKLAILPDEVIEAFNELIAKKWNGSESMIKQPDVIDLIIEKMELKAGPTTNFDRDWLEVEDIYRARGWTVEYDKPGCDESYTATFIFRKVPRPVV